MTDFMVALAILVIAVLPVGYGLWREHALARQLYRLTAATEIVDGELERLALGEWRAWKEGTHPYPVRAASATNLGPGRFQLTRSPHRLRLEWIPADHPDARPVARELQLP
jgi:hypothetical protein